MSKPRNVWLRLLVVQNLEEAYRLKKTDSLLNKPLSLARSLARSLVSRCNLVLSRDSLGVMMFERKV